MAAELQPRRDGWHQTREPPMIDCRFVQGDQSLAPTKRANQNLEHKTPPYALLGRNVLGLLCGPGTSPGARNPVKLRTAWFCGWWALLPRRSLRNLSGWGVILQTEMLWVKFPIRIHAWFVDSVPGRGAYKRQPICASLSHQCFPLSLPPFLFL